MDETAFESEIEYMLSEIILQKQYCCIEEKGLEALKLEYHQHTLRLQNLYR